jgi:hypothetical protein
MDIKRKMITLLVREFLQSAHIDHFQISLLKEGAAFVEHSGKLFVFYDRILWECTHPEVVVNDPESPILKELEIGFFPYPKPDPGATIVPGEYAEKFLSSIPQTAEERRQRAIDRGNFE